jgi:hypothetical protein
MIMFNIKEEAKKEYALLLLSKLLDISTTLYEDRLFFEFDSYGNFLLSNHNTMVDIKDIINKTTTYTSIPMTIKTYNFMDKINPYGLEKVVFTGGGTKGIVYIGAFLGLLASGQIFYLNHFAGTSVGALTAMVIGCITPGASEYNMIKIQPLKELLRHDRMVEKYKDAIRFVMERLCKRNFNTFYSIPVYSFFGIWTAFDTIIKNNGLYDPQKTGFHIWYALICKKVCKIMNNGLDELMIIKKKDGTNVVFSNSSDDETDINMIDTDVFIGWELIRFFTFQEYHNYTNKRLVFTGTKTKHIETAYYTDLNISYKDLSVMTAGMASISIPWIFKPPIINGSYNLDGGIYDNYPLTHCDIKIRDKITHYNNKIFGYLIDDKNIIIDAYEIIRELWIVYIGFIEITNIKFVKDSMNYPELCELFFEIRNEVYKLLYFTDIDIETFLNKDDTESRERICEFNIRDFEEIFNELDIDIDIDKEIFELPKLGIDHIIGLFKCLDSSYRDFESMFRIGRKTDLADIMELSIRQGIAYNILKNHIMKDKSIIDNMITDKSDIIIKYENTMNKILSNILAYYELKGTFINTNDLENPSKNFIEIINTIYHKILNFEKMINNSIIEINTKQANKDLHIKNYLKHNIDVGIMLSKSILSKSSEYTNIDNPSESLIEEKSSYQKAIDFFFHTDLTGILYKYVCIASDRICNDSFNRMRTIKINTFESHLLDFNMDDDMKARLIYEGYSKTIKYFTNLLHIMELTGRNRSDDEYLESYEIRYKKHI